ncbi:hypothetical protein [Streptomyces millisiae]|uniref:Chromosome partitioning protein n=1 Tax=Streptomyces millisiae TaxID=3075542 RepID=A0ABU2LV15_9ACTN|nr:hypothetical protein [Streptomyces sp. DSM 44918]MDT0321441.1 hypothetical protein [Streptomyces sp. DSM 44918]
MGMEVAVGYVFAWLMSRVAGRAEARVEEALDAGVHRLGELITGKLGTDPALERAVEEAEAGLGEPSERTRRRLTDSLEDAVERDPAFATALERLLRQLQARAGGGVSASGDGQAIAGDVHITAESGSAAALRMGDVTLGPAPGNPPGPDPSRG